MSPLNETLEGAMYSFCGWLSEYCNRNKIRSDHWPNCVMVNRWSNNEVNLDPHSTKRKSQSLNFHQGFSIHKAADDFIAALAAVDLSLIVNLSSNRFWLWSNVWKVKSQWFPFADVLLLSLSLFLFGNVSSSSFLFPPMCLLL